MEENLNQTPPPKELVSETNVKRNFPITPSIIGVVVLAIVIVSIVLLFSNKKKLEFIDINSNLITPEQLKHRDVDKDGLSDYDELTKYHTLFFKSDTDEDGVSDGDEVRDGADPKDNIKNIDNSKKPLPDFGDLKIKIISRQCEINFMSGDIIQVQGGGFKANEEVILRMPNNSPDDYLVGITKAGEDGEIDLEFTIPRGLNITETGVEALGIGTREQGHLLIGDIMYIANSCLHKDNSEQSSLFKSLPFKVYLPPYNNYSVKYWITAKNQGLDNPQRFSIGFDLIAKDQQIRITESRVSSFFAPPDDCREIPAFFSEDRSIDHRPCSLLLTTPSGIKVYSRKTSEHSSDSSIMTTNFYFVIAGSFVELGIIDPLNKYQDLPISNEKISNMVDAFIQIGYSEISNFKEM
ncbi:hypothetical protein A3J56_00575 [Candidatus Giovannonibacteria bacterium RIFCSPHIGHO2_02_FULL_46_20]|uniref:Uncharacterized protein n=1 Tax=Candidatus Giovannonibacteria bacterium RIFCSPHIGHO2_02_FULL_46_20 TaxID=1798338 RepID=A0A1F5WD15_9BACT|nr:MAG: hypothetical protein A3J56_00575 [Candidatus Giovannonibacteria bacterium RIFCSPHIGHO2_02_FULL_46_20]